MSDELLPFYEKELAYIRELGKEFSQAHPKIAANLGLAEETIEDPHVSRLIESFAFLNARIQYKLEDDFPEISESFLNTLYPHYLRQTPSCSVVQFIPDEEKADNVTTIKKGSYLDTEKFQDTRCRFRTIYPVDILPLSIKSVKLKCSPFSTPGSKHARGAGSVLQIKLETINNDFNIHELEFDHIRFYLKGQNQYIHPFYELIFRKCHGIVITNSEDDLRPVYLDKTDLKQVGMQENEGLLPYPEQSFKGYRLLTEFFVFPEKFMFFDIENIKYKLDKTYTNELNIYIYLDDTELELERNINKENLLLGCTPVVNLFPVQAEPVKLNYHENQYEIIPDIRQFNSLEVYSIDGISISDSAGNIRPCAPFYGKNHDGSKNNIFWSANKQFRHTGAQKYVPKLSTYIKLTDLNFDLSAQPDSVMITETTCTNHDLPGLLPLNSGEHTLYSVSQSAPTKLIQLLHQPSACIYPPLRNNARWRLISHLNLNFLSLTKNNALESFKEILRLYDFTDRQSIKSVIDSITSLDVKQITAPIIINGVASMCNGIEINIELDGKMLTGTSSYLFASILENFFTLYCPINSFTCCSTKLKGKEGYIKKCTPLSGTKIIL